MEEEINCAYHLRGFPILWPKIWLGGNRPKKGGKITKVNSKIGHDFICEALICANSPKVRGYPPRLDFCRLVDFSGEPPFLWPGTSFGRG